MTLRQYVYISGTKLDQLHPQIPPGFMSANIKGSGELSLGVMKVKLESEAAGDSATDIARLRDVVKYIAGKGELGEPGSEFPFFSGKVYAHCLELGGQIFLFGTDRASTDDILLGFSCSAKHMVGGGYESNSYEAPGTEVGKVRARHINVTSSNAQFASALASLDISEERVAELQQRHHQLRSDWLTKFRPTKEELAAIAQRRFVNAGINFLHYNPMSQIEFSLFGNEWPPDEPKPPLKTTKLYKPIAWLLGDALYRQKLGALNKLLMYRKADEQTAVLPMTQEILRTIKSQASSTEGSAQTYEYVAMRVLDGVVDGSRVVLGSPLYLCQVGVKRC
jgi:hypothetical protein